MESNMDVKALSVGGHDAIFDSIVDHLHEMTRAARTAMQVTVFGCAAELLAPRGRWGRVSAGCKRLEDRIEALDRLPGATDHHAVPALKSPYSAARTYVEVVDA